MRALIPLLASAWCAAATADPVALALQRKLADDPAWHTLLHVVGNRSEIDDPRFFLAAQGQHDATAELVATIRAFTDADPQAVDAVVQRFPARAAWLAERLQLSLPTCRAFEQQYPQLGEATACLAFPSSNIRSPSSMFGHTLLIIRNRNQTGLTGTSISYAARVGDENAIAYAVKGMGGAFPGFTSLQPYWQKIAEYRDIDRRDVWEYDLDLTPAEIRRMLLHIWELNDIRIDYWFFDENCASMLLWFLDAARDHVGLHAQARSWVIPLDTVRLVHEAGMVRCIRRRPSLGSAIHRQAKTLADGGLQARAAAHGDIDPATLDAASLDLAADWLQALRYRGEVDQSAYQQRLFPILSARSRLPTTTQRPEPAELAHGPEAGHRSLRLALAGGSQGGRGYGELGIRPAYHDLLDPDTGFEPGAQVTFANVVLRHSNDTALPVIERIEPVTVRTTSPWNPFFPAWSWHAGGGLVRERGGIGDTGELMVQAQGGFGVSLALPGRGLAWALAEIDGRLADRGRTTMIGGGPGVGALVRPAEDLQVLAEGRWLAYAGGDHPLGWQASLRTTWSIHPDLALTVSFARTDSWGWLRNESSLGVLSYF